MAALNYLNENSGLLIANLGTDKSTSVMELMRAFEVESNKVIPFRIEDRRKGDLPEYYADSHFAKSVLGWEAHYGIECMCADTWRWQSMNPNGYR